MRKIQKNNRDELRRSKQDRAEGWESDAVASDYNCVFICQYYYQTPMGLALALFILSYPHMSQTSS